MKSLFRSMPALAFGALLGASLTLGEGVLAGKNETETLPLEDLRTFTEIFAKIKNDYVEPIEDKTLLENAIRGMLAGLDPHSAYLVPDDYKELQAGTSGEFGGLGIEVGMEDGFVKVISPIDDTPAQRAGVKAGDLIIRLDDTPVKGMALSDAVKIMRGKPGTDIVLTIVREGKDQPLKISITRDVIRVTSVKSRMLDPGYGYIRISQFQSRTGESLREAISKLEEKANGTLKGLVLDLRNNPGGVLSAAVAVSDAFLTDGIIVYTEGRLEDAKLKFNAKPTDMLDGAPIVVLVNGGSASASEIVAGALQDHRRAIIMGQKTFGKGSVQTILPMDNGSALKLTTAKYFTPSGVSIQAKGISPDIELENLKLADSEGSGTSRIKEADLAGHLEGEAEKRKGADSSKQGGAEERPLARRDYAIFEALNLLKGLSILQKQSS
ncbi:MAG: PDZ domain-containing protein [Gammaproteobacteria bacterium]|nr:PDZ domain-containing protein [Gammaproteobacteria bacterium]NIM75038.1 PDZ domain-containing protein [Gammaproteobacteria bacterium]NIN40088.1 PDZ domain-containing protein [Gammaproteobacteria bacterium]NIO26575.1 PDZ domain-containing protein [Gammaproteobacteria bacterium]NIO67127.1 PDZ domain-containing protein [Gammaproteobacteria bacterium]